MGPRLGCERGSTGARGSALGCSTRLRSGFGLLPRAGGFGGTSTGGCGGGWSRSRSCDIVYFELPPADEDEPELEPAPVSVETGLEGVAGLVEVVSVGGAAADVVSLVVDELVGEAVFAVEPGVALVPELLYEVDVLASLLQPARATVASAIAATYEIKRFMMAPVKC